ncbi:MAG: type II toxin-antitoxin system Phd/YefM family antitoxin [Gemmatimonadetes bacterium]|nr:type II toxin-antitoxin system Phd/YefM family antitoxin [Gemmatimonadota bacterium]
MHTWKLEDAKNRFSEVVRLALSHEPQRVTRNGRDAVVVISAEDYERLVAPDSLVDFLRESPLAEALSSGELDLDRPRDLGRDVTL